MKFTVTAIILGTMSLSAFAEISPKQTITCSNNQYSIDLEVDKLEKVPPKTAYKIYKNNKLIKTGAFQKSLEIYEGSFLNAYIWKFTDTKKNSIGIATQDFQSPTDGEWSGKADVSIDTNEGLFEGTSIDCQIVIGSGSDEDSLLKANEISCGKSSIDVSPYTVRKQTDSEYATHTVDIDGEVLPLVLNKEKSNPTALSFDFTASSDKYESILISGNPSEMTLFPFDESPVTQRTDCEIIY